MAFRIARRFLFSFDVSTLCLTTGRVYLDSPGVGGPVQVAEDRLGDGLPGRLIVVSVSVSASSAWAAATAAGQRSSNSSNSSKHNNNRSPIKPFIHSFIPPSLPSSVPHPPYLSARMSDRFLVPSTFLRVVEASSWVEVAASLTLQTAAIGLSIL